MAHSVTRRDDLIIIGADIARVEPGYQRKTAKATKTVMDALREDATAAEAKFLYEVGGFDANGNVIVAGKEFGYIDRASPRVLYVYGRRDLSAEDQAARQTSYTYIFEVRKTFPLDKEADAIAFAQKLAGE